MYPGISSKIAQRKVLTGDCAGLFALLPLRSEDLDSSRSAAETSIKLPTFRSSMLIPHLMRAAPGANRASEPISRIYSLAGNRSGLYDPS